MNDGGQIKKLEEEYLNLLRICPLSHKIVGGWPVVEKVWPDFQKKEIHRITRELYESFQKEGDILGYFNGRSHKDLLKELGEDFIQNNSNKHGWELLLGSQRHMQRHFAEITQAASEYGMKSPLQVYPALFPTGSFNAQSVRVKFGVLILVELGLSVFVYECAKRYTGALNIDIERDQITRAHVANRMSDDEVVKSLATFILTYVTQGVPKGERLSVPKGVHSLVTSLLIKNTEEFILAHEYGHVLAGHLTSPKTVHRAVGQSGVELDYVQKNWDEEAEADDYALILLIPPSKSKPKSVPDAQWVGLRLQGAFLAFGLDWLITSVVSELHGQGRETYMFTDHPPGQMRAERLLSTLAKRWAPPILTYPRQTYYWFRNIEPQVRDFIREWLRTSADHSI